MTTLTTHSAGPLVAIVTPVYNGEKDLETAIQAVQAQTYRPLVHCILDNASTDGTAAIIARYANADIPIITRRNERTLSFQENFNAVLDLIPAEASHFRMLHADDSMPPHAIAEMMALAKQGDDIIMVAGGERLNERDRPHFFPPECSIYDAGNMLARALSDEAHIPSAHVLYRTDVMHEGEEFYPTDTVECVIAAYHRVLSRGGRAGFAHCHIADTRRYAGSGSLFDTFAPKVKAVIWEKLLFIERYGPAVLSNTEYARVHRRFLRVYARRLLWWSVSGSASIAARDYQRLKERGCAPHLLDFVTAVAVWPWYLFLKRFGKPHAPKPWPTDAVTSLAPGERQVRPAPQRPRETARPSR